MNKYGEIEPDRNIDIEKYIKILGIRRKITNITIGMERQRGQQKTRKNNCT